MQVSDSTEQHTTGTEGEGYRPQITARSALTFGELVGLYFGVIVIAAGLRYGLLPLVFSIRGPNDYLEVVALNVSAVAAIAVVAISRPGLFRRLSFHVSFPLCLFAIAAGIVEANLGLFAVMLRLPVSLESHSIVSIIHAALVGPAIEELLFRGVILNSLAERFSIPTAVLLSSAAFASFHAMFWPGLIGGLVLGGVYVISRRSLTASFITHSAENLIVTLPIKVLLYVHFLHH